MTVTVLGELCDVNEYVACAAVAIELTPTW